MIVNVMNEPHLGAGVYEDGKVEVGLGNTVTAWMTIKQWRELNEKIEGLAKNANLGSTFVLCQHECLGPHYHSSDQ